MVKQMLVPDQLVHDVICQIPSQAMSNCGAADDDPHHTPVYQRPMKPNAAMNQNGLSGLQGGRGYLT